MPRDLNRRPSGETLSVGNVVSAGLRIYRDNFKIYYLEALKSYLWLFVPVYGWAKFAAIQAIISRLAFFEVRETPESLADARRQVMPKMWIFLVTGILIGLIFFAGFFVFGIAMLLLGVGFFASIQNNPLVSLVIGLFIVLSFFLLLFANIWLISRLGFAELAIAIDGVKEATKAIGRSWTITQGFVAKIQIIFFIAFLLTIPFSAISNIGSLLLQNPEMGAVINLLLTIPLGALLIPFWQSIKAVIYYDLLTRKEGLGLELRDLTDNF
jgi:hypothetical protein